MEVINSISNIKSKTDFSTNEEHKKYLVENYRLLVNKLSALKEELEDYKKIQVEVLKHINNSSEDTNNSSIMINDNITEDIEILELSELTKEKPKNKKFKTVENTDEVEKPRTKAKSKKLDTANDSVTVVASEEDEEEKPKPKPKSKKLNTVANLDTVVASEQEEKPKPKPKAKSKKSDSATVVASNSEEEEKPKTKAKSKKSDSVIDNNDESTEDKPKKKSNSVKDDSTKEKTKIKNSDSV